MVSRQINQPRNFNTNIDTTPKRAVPKPKGHQSKPKCPICGLRLISARWLLLCDNCGYHEEPSERFREHGR